MKVKAPQNSFNLKTLVIVIVKKSHIFVASMINQKMLEMFWAIIIYYNNNI